MLRWQMYRRYWFSLCNFFEFQSVNFKIKWRSQRFLFATLKLLPWLKFVSHFIRSRLISHLILPCHSLPHLVTPYPLGWKQNHFHLATLKLVLRIIFLSHFPLGIKNSFPDRITRMSFYQKYFQLFLPGKFAMKEKKLLVV